MASGIYCILNLVNGNDYIGSSIDIHKRWDIHRCRLNSNDRKRSNKHLLNAWNKHGQDNFLFFIIEEIEVCDLEKAEQYYLDKEKPIYNAELVVHYLQYKTRQIHQYSLQGNFIKTWPSVNEAARKLNTNASLLCRAALGHRTQSNNFIWSYEKKDMIKKHTNLHFRSVLQYDKNEQLIKNWDTMSDAARFLGISNKAIYMCLKRKSHTSGGFIWKYGT